MAATRNSPTGPFPAVQQNVAATARLLAVWIFVFGLSGFLTIAAGALPAATLCIGLLILGGVGLGYAWWVSSPRVESIEVLSDGLVLRYTHGRRGGRQVVPKSWVQFRVLDASPGTPRRGPELAEPMRTRFWILVRNPRLPPFTKIWLGLPPEAVPALRRWTSRGESG